MPGHPARRLWVTPETLHDVTYFAEGVRPAGIALGLRAAPLGPVPAGPAVAPPGDALGRLWQLATTLREHRGDGHIAAMVSEGITGLEAHLLQAAAGRFPQPVIRQVCGWSEGEWAAAADALCARGLLSRDAAASPEGAVSPAGEVLSLTPAGRAVLDTIEAHTDERAWTGGLAALGKQGVEEVLALLRPSARAVAASGMLPEINPTGLPYPS